MKAKELLVLFGLLFLLALQLSSPKEAEEGSMVKSIKFVVEPPTLMNLGFEWCIEGGSNRNAAVQVSYRKKGDDTWKTAQPLLRHHALREQFMQNPGERVAFYPGQAQVGRRFAQHRNVMEAAAAAGDARRPKYLIGSCTYTN